MLAIEMFTAQQSVQISFGKWWGLTGSDEVLRGEVVVDGSSIGNLESEWTLRAFDSYKSVIRTRQSTVRFTNHAKWTIQTEIPPDLPDRRTFGFKTRPLRDIRDRRVTLSDSEESDPLASFFLKGPRDRPRGVLEDRSQRRFTVQGGASLWSIGSVAADGGQPAFNVRRNLWRFHSSDEIKVETPSQLEIVLLAWHMMRGDYRRWPWSWLFGVWRW